MFVKNSTYIKALTKLNEVDTALARANAQLEARDSAYYERKAKEDAETLKLWHDPKLEKRLANVTRERDDFKLKYTVLCAATKTATV